MRADHEFGFELRVCAWAEREWPPTRDADADRRVVVGRQIGTRRRRWDTVVVETTATALDARGAFGSDELGGDLLRIVRHAPAEWAWYRDAIPEPSFPWRYVREAVHSAADRGLIETRRRDGRIQIRRIRRYPDWADRIVAIENKPDLDASAARNLADQIERDVALGLADEVWIATRATGDGVEPVLYEDLPVEAGVLVVDGDGTASVEWYPSRLHPDESGTRVLERGDDADSFEYVPADEKRRRRRVLAERVYGRGWRDYAETMRPDCRHFDLVRDGDAGVLRPACAAKGRVARPAECAGDCPSFEPEPPTWRTKGWPIEGGPGKRYEQLLAERRDRRR